MLMCLIQKQIPFLYPYCQNILFLCSICTNENKIQILFWIDECWGYQFLFVQKKNVQLSGVWWDLYHLGVWIKVDIDVWWTLFWLIWFEKNSKQFVISCLRTIPDSCLISILKVFNLIVKYVQQQKSTLNTKIVWIQIFVSFFHIWKFNRQFIFLKQKFSESFFSIRKILKWMWNIFNKKVLWTQKLHGFKSLYPFLH